MFKFMIYLVESEAAPKVLVFRDSSVARGPRYFHIVLAVIRTPVLYRSSKRKAGGGGIGGLSLLSVNKIVFSLRAKAVTDTVVNGIKIKNKNILYFKINLHVF